MSERESLWDQLEQKSFKPIQIDDELYDPFDTILINASLLPRGMGARSVSHFFLGKLDATNSYNGYQAFILAEECARDLTVPPAMALDNNIFIRKKSIRKILWEKVQEWQWNKIENAMSKVLSFYEFNGEVNSVLYCMSKVRLKRRKFWANASG